MKDIVILGAGGTAFEVIDIIHAINKVSPTWNILGMLDDNVELLNKEVYGYNVLGDIPSSKFYPDAFFCSSIGSAYDTSLRKRVREKVPFDNEHFATLIHPNAVISDTATIESGVVIYSNVHVSAKAHIGHDSFLVFNTVVAHECIVGRHCILTVGVFMPSDVHLGECCYIGVGVSFRHQLSVGNNCLIGMGTRVVKSIPDNTKLINKLENILSAI